MSALEEVNVEEQLQNQEDSDSPVIKINTEVSEEKKEPKFKVGQLVKDTINFVPGQEVEPIYQIMEVTDEGKYLIEQVNVGEGEKADPPREMDADDLIEFTPPSPEFANEAKFELTSEQQKLVDKGIEEEEAAENLNEITSDETDSDDESDEDEDDFKKLENDISKEYLMSYHPELKQINFNELIALSKITRNKDGIIIDPLHKTFPYLTKFERAKILGQRAKQINNGSPIFVKVTPNIIDGHTIALMELQQKKIPFIIKRPLPNGSNEYWKVSDLNILD
jgi:DNA-directed RNA polymerase I, II, and III subunit RPABC2